MTAPRHGKDRPPDETVREARRILGEIAFAVLEEPIKNAAPGCYSVALRAVELPDITVAGKGVSPQLALASAYGELMEYLQNRVIPGLLFGLMPPPPVVFADQVAIPFAQICSKSGHVVAALIERSVDGNPFDDNHELECVPFYNARSRRLDYLPIRLVQLACGSNGMCAGNTPSEALVHGLCEVFEHYVVRQVYAGALGSFPTIPDSAICRTDAYAIIQAVRQAGFVVQAKDCTLGGKYPVVGVILLHPATGRYRVKFGSEPDFDLALQRCLTEAFQGIHASQSPAEWMNEFDFARPFGARGPFAAAEKNRQVEYFRTMTFGTGEMPFDLMRSAGKPLWEAVFNQRHSSTRSALAFVCHRVRDTGWELLARDVSFLGFPAYRVYVPGMSEWAPLSHEFLHHDSAHVRRCLLRLTELSVEDARKCIDLIEFKRANFPGYFVTPYDNVRQWACIRFHAPTDFDRFRDVDLLLTLLYLRVADYHRALECLQAYLDRTRTITNRAYFIAAAAYLRSRADGRSSAQTQVELEQLFGASLADEVTRDISDPERTFDGWTLPVCGDCAACPVSAACGYEAWHRVTQSIMAKMEAAQIDQMGLAGLVS